MDLSREDYIRGEIAKNRIRRQTSPPDPRGQMQLPGMADDEPLPLGPNYQLSPEQMEINRRGMEMVRGILSRRKAFTEGQTPAPPTIHHEGEPPCIGC